jgi:hypothetical protein
LKGRLKTETQRANGNCEKADKHKRTVNGVERGDGKNERKSQASDYTSKKTPPKMIAFFKPERKQKLRA